jgi:uncharacterized membrane protein
MEHLTGKELLKALDDLGKRIPVIKLERVETLYPTVKNAQKSVVSNSNKEPWSLCVYLHKHKQNIKMVLQPALMDLKVY